MTMTSYINFHTHHADNRPDVVSILNLEPTAFLKSDYPGSQLLSVGHHPWRVGVQTGAELATMAQVLQDKQIAAVGEIGLDKCCEVPLSDQIEAFKAQLRMAACVQKPVIIHCVKAWDELLQTLSQVDNLPPVIIHGFRGKPQLARQLVDHNCLLSFGLKFNADTLLSLPVGSFFLETDDVAGADICQLYAEVSQLMNVEVDCLKNGIGSLWISLKESQLL